MQVCGCIDIHLSPLPSMVKFSRARFLSCFSFCVIIYLFLYSLTLCVACIYRCCFIETHAQTSSVVFEGFPPPRASLSVDGHPRYI